MIVPDQPRSLKTGRQLPGNLHNLVTRKPGIDHLDLLPQDLRHGHFGEMVAEGKGRSLLLFRQVNNLPAKAGKLVEQRLFTWLRSSSLYLSDSFILKSPSIRLWLARRVVCAYVLSAYLNDILFHPHSSPVVQPALAGSALVRLAAG